MEKRDQIDENLEKNAIIVKGSISVGSSLAGALVGIAIGGPVGSIVGAVTGSSVAIIGDLLQKYQEKRRERALNAVQEAFLMTGLSENQIAHKLSEDTRSIDEFSELVRALLESDEALDSFFTNIMSQLIMQTDDIRHERLMILAAEVKGLRRTQLHILIEIYNNDRMMSASMISEKLGVPEIELRYMVRDLELRGMIEDRNSEPTVWYLRELGIAIAKAMRKENNENEIS